MLSPKLTPELKVPPFAAETKSVGSVCEFIVPSEIAAFNCAVVKEPSTAALPFDVICPVKLAFVVTVAALPDILVWSPVLLPDMLASESAVESCATVNEPNTAAFPLDVT